LQVALLAARTRECRPMNTVAVLFFGSCQQHIHGQQKWWEYEFEI